VPYKRREEPGCRAELLSFNHVPLTRVGTLSLSRLERLNVHAVSKSLLELNYTVNESEERVITASTYVVTSVIRASTLTNENISRTNNLSAVLLNAKALALTVSTVSGTSYRFLMCHDITLDFQTHNS
jgi:hypothetical protein